MPIEATNGLSAGGRVPIAAPSGTLAPDLLQPRAVRFLLERLDAPVPIEPEDAHRRRVVDVDRLGRDRDVRARLDVRVDQLAEVHAIEMIAGENQVVVGVVRQEVTHRLTDGVGGALEPVGVLRASARPRGCRRTRAEKSSSR